MRKNVHPGSMTVIGAQLLILFYPDSFAVCPEQESGGGEYIRGDGGER